MLVVTCIKQVPDTTQVKIDPKTGTLVREGVPFIMNPFDTHALEESLRLKDKYGTPDKQLIKTSSVRAKNKRTYSTSVKNKAIWNINDSQDFIAEIESEQVVYELVDNNPEKIIISKKPEINDEQEFRIENWDPDY